MNKNKRSSSSKQLTNDQRQKVSMSAETALAKCGNAQMNPLKMDELT